MFWRLVVRGGIWHSAHGRSYRGTLTDSSPYFMCGNEQMIFAPVLHFRTNVQIRKIMSHFSGIFKIYVSRSGLQMWGKGRKTISFHHKLRKLGMPMPTNLMSMYNMLSND